MRQGEVGYEKEGHERGGHEKEGQSVAHQCTKGLDFELRPEGGLGQGQDQGQSQGCFPRYVGGFIGRSTVGRTRLAQRLALVLLRCKPVQVVGGLILIPTPTPMCIPILIPSLSSNNEGKQHKDKGKDKDKDRVEHHLMRKEKEKKK